MGALRRQTQYIHTFDSAGKGLHNFTSTTGRDRESLTLSEAVNHTPNPDVDVLAGSDPHA
jgi:hypothetical protein